MPSIKRTTAFIISLCASAAAIIFMISESKKDAEPVFMQPHCSLCVYDEESLLPVPLCSIYILPEGEHHKTDSNGKLSLSGNDISLIVKKEGYAPHILLHADSNEDAVVLLKKRGLTQYSVSLGKSYLNKLLLSEKTSLTPLKTSESSE